MTTRYVFYILILFIAAAFTAPPDLIGDVNRVLKSYYTNKDGAQLHITLNQPQYAAGDTAFFSGYLFQAGSRKNITGKHVVTLQLLDSNLNAVFTNRYLFDGGTYRGRFIMPANTTPGYKLLRGFSDEMVVNHDTLGFVEMPVNIVTKNRQTLAFPVTPQVGIEGGNLVAGVLNRVVILYAPHTRIQITDAAHQTVSAVTTDSTGSAVVSFIPAIHAKYYLQTKEASTPLSTTTSAAASIILVKDETSEHYSLSIHADNTLRAQPGYLVISNQADVISSRTFTFGQDSILTFPYTNTTPGVNRITIFSDKRQVLAERLLYVPLPAANLHATVAQLPVHTRSSVTLDLLLHDAGGKSMTGTYAVSVLKNDIFTWPKVQRNSQAIVSLQAEGINCRQLYLYPQADIDNVLVACYTPTIPWQKLLSGQNVTATREKVNPYYFRGRAVFRDTKLPVPDSTLVTFYINKERFIFGRHTMKGGNLEFPMFMNFEDDELFYRAEYKKKILPGVIIITDPLPPSHAFGARQIRKADIYEKFSSLRKVIDQSFRFYGSTSATAVEEDDEIKGWKDDFHINLENLEPFVSMPLVLQEVVPTVQLRNNKTSVRVFLKPSAMFATKDPVYIIDGVMTDSTGFFLSLPPADVSTIRVLRSDINLTRFGSLGRNGIIIVTTHHNKYAPLVPNISSYFAKGIERMPTRAAGIWQPTTSNSRIPDLRSALYWGYAVPTDGKAQIQFSTGDLTGQYKVIVEGKTDTGQFISFEDYIDVIYKEAVK